MRVIAAVVFCVAATTLNAGAQATSSDQAIELRKKIQAAQQHVDSFRIEMSSPAGMTGISTITMRPLRMHMQVASGPVNVEMYALDGYLYQRVATGPWRRQQLPAEKAMPNNFVRTLNDAVHMTLGPDVTENGTTYGSYDVEAQTASIPGAPHVGPMQVTCTYDKSTFLLHSCKNGLFTESFVGYNDPNNKVTAPPDLANAVDAGPIFPTSSRTPQPSASYKP